MTHYKEKYREDVDFEKLKAGDTVEVTHGIYRHDKYHLEAFYKIKEKPALTPIDLSVLIDSQIDCEFSDYLEDSEGHENKNWKIGKLSYIGGIGYRSENGTTWAYCRPRINHVHAWQGGDNPLPDGVTVKAFYRSPRNEFGIAESSSLSWEHQNNRSDIVAFEVLGPSEGHCWPYDADK